MGYKAKTNRAARKRFRITKSGTIKRSRAYGSHLLGHKSMDRKRRYRKLADVHKTNRKEIIRLLPYIKQ
jgi:large subunit ribosomal protein L35